MNSITAFDSILAKQGIVRTELLPYPSPILFLPKLSQEIGHRIFVKRDDLSSIGMGGNKLRKLEYLLAEAKSQKATRILTIGARQSNHARLTAFAASMCGFPVDLILKNSVSNAQELYKNNGNIVLDRLVGALIHEIPNDDRAGHYVEELIKDYQQQGERPYFIPVGGSNTIGGLGYARAALEIEAQAAELGLSFSHIAIASGSGGTHAGLLAGYAYLQKDTFIQAYNVQVDREAILRETESIATEVLQLLGAAEQSERLTYRLSNEYVGEGYGLLNPETKGMIQKMAQLEGMLLDPVYAGKAFTGFVEDIKNQRFAEPKDLLFIHTGGTASLFAYANDLK